jgi:hypothetical protein
MSHFDQQIGLLKASLYGVAATMEMSFAMTDYLFPPEILMLEAIPAFRSRAAGLSFRELGSASLLDKGLRLEPSASRAALYKAQDIHFLRSQYEQDRKIVATAVTRHVNGTGTFVDIVGSSSPLKPRQRLLAERMGIVTADRFARLEIGIHAEPGSLLEGGLRNLEPVAGGVAGPKICRRCGLRDIPATGGIEIGPQEYVFPEAMERLGLGVFE